MPRAQTENTRDRYYHQLLDQGMRLTQPRSALLDLLLENPEHEFTADELYRILHERAPGMISRASVFRIMRLFASAQLVKREKQLDQRYVYSLLLGDLTGCQYRLVDLEEGSTVRIPPDKELRRVLSRICREQGFTELYHTLEVYGRFAKQRGRRRSGEPAKTATKGATGGGASATVALEAVAESA